VSLRRKDRWQPFGKHGLAGTWRTDQEHVVAARCRNGECVNGIVLTYHVT
jgi:hypothetical protein